MIGKLYEELHRYPVLSIEQCLSIHNNSGLWKNTCGLPGCLLHISFVADPPNQDSNTYRIDVSIRQGGSG